MEDIRKQYKEQQRQIRLDNKEEIWKDIPEYEGLYQASTYGRIKSLKKCRGTDERILKPGLGSDGYYIVILYNNNNKKVGRIHRIVADLFIENIDKLSIVNHKNGVKTDNNIENLEWCTSSQNNYHAYKHGLKVITENNFFKTNNPNPGKGCFGKNHFNAKKIGQYSLDGNLIKIRHSIVDIEREDGINKNGISMCCRGKRKSAGGFIWKYQI